VEFDQSRRRAIIALVSATLDVVVFVGGLAVGIWLAAGLLIAAFGYDGWNAPSLGRNGTLLLGAISAATLGVVGNISVKSNELRNGLADRLAEVTLEYYHQMADLLDFAQEDRKYRQEFDAAAALVEEQRAVVDRLSGEEGGQHDFREAVALLEVLAKNLKKINKRAPKNAKIFTRDREVVLNKVLMYGSTEMHLFARRVDAAAYRYVVDTDDPGLREEASRELLRFLDESRRIAANMRRWWGRRYIAAYWLTLRLRVLTMGEAIDTLLASVATEELAPVPD
jgi:hypothetical protein